MLLRTCAVSFCVRSKAYSLKKVEKSSELKCFNSQRLSLYFLMKLSAELHFLEKLCSVKSGDLGVVWNDLLMHIYFEYEKGCLPTKGYS